ncbi:MAG TPA: hypothetical protein VNK49_08485, partial [Anaerolineales bacterium]|nr:hypothetical protein [Anaerolineales bacterium]
MTTACSPAQDTLPYATNFRAGASAPLGGEITETSQISPAEIQSFQSEVEKAIACSPYREAIEAAGGS